MKNPDDNFCCENCIHYPCAPCHERHCKNRRLFIADRELWLNGYREIQEEMKFEDNTITKSIFK